MDGDPSLLAIIAFAFLLAGFVKGVVGLGLPTVAIGLLTLAMTPAQAAALVVVPSLVTNIWQSLAGPDFGRLARRLWPMLAAIVVGCWLGGGMLASGDSAHAITALGVVLIVYAAIGLSRFRPSVPPRAEPWLSPLIGLVTGVVTAATGVFVIPAGPYLQALGIDKDELVQALGLSFTVSTLALAAVLARDGVLAFSLAGASLLALAPALIGMWLGQIVRTRVRPEIFRLVFLVGLLLLGAHLTLRGYFV